MDDNYPPEMALTAPYVARRTEHDRHPSSLKESIFLQSARKGDERPDSIQILGGEFKGCKISNDQIDAVCMFLAASKEFIDPSSFSIPHESGESSDNDSGESTTSVEDTTGASDRFSVSFRKGFFLGDRMGVGKTATIAMSFLQFILHQLTQESQESQESEGIEVTRTFPNCGKHVLLVPKADLVDQFEDTFSAFVNVQAVKNIVEASLTDARIRVLRVGDVFKKEPAPQPANPAQAQMYQGASQARQRKTLYMPDQSKAGILVCTYHFLASNFAAILLWMRGTSLDPFLGFDECHHMKTETSHCSVGAKSLSRAFPRAAFLASSGAGISKVSELSGIGERLGLWANMQEFNLLQKRLVGRHAAAYISHQMASNGTYISRMLDVSEATETVVYPIRLSDVESNAELYDLCADLMTKTIKTIEDHFTSHSKFRIVKARTQNTSFFFFRQLLLHFRLFPCVEKARQLMHEEGMSIVFAMQATSESYVENDNRGIANIPFKLLRFASEMAPTALPKWEALRTEWENGPVASLPIESTMELLFKEFGGVEHVADLTGRTKYIDHEGVLRRRPVGDVRQQMRLFQADEKLVAIASDTTREGFNLHAHSPTTRRRALFFIQENLTATALDQMRARVSRTSQYKTALVYHFPFSDVCEGTFTTRHAAGERAASSLTQGNMSVLARTDELSDALSARGVRALSILFLQLKNGAAGTVGLRTEQTRQLLGMDREAWRAYCTATLERLKESGAMDAFGSASPQSRMYISAARHGTYSSYYLDAIEAFEANEDDGMTATTDPNFDASEATECADDVRKVFNRFLLFPLSLQQSLLVHFASEISEAQSISTHVKPVKTKFQVVRRTRIGCGNVELLRLHGINLFDDVLSIHAEHGGDWFASPDRQQICLLVDVHRVRWKISSDGCVPRGKVPFLWRKQESLSLDNVDGLNELNSIWDTSSFRRNLLINVPCRLIHDLRVAAGESIKRTSYQQLNGAPLIGVSIGTQDVDEDHPALRFFRNLVS